MTTFSDVQLDALRELANIGSGNAGTALGTMQTEFDRVRSENASLKERLDTLTTQKVDAETSFSQLSSDNHRLAQELATLELGPETDLELRSKLTAEIAAERFTSPTLEALEPDARSKAVTVRPDASETGQIALSVVVDGKAYDVRMGPEDNVLDAALTHGLDLPYSCKGGVCSTCRCKVLQGAASMNRNFTLDASEIAAGWILSCQAVPTGANLRVTFDER